MHSAAAAAVVSVWQVTGSAHYLARIHGKMFMGSFFVIRPLQLISHEEQLRNNGSPYMPWTATWQHSIRLVPNLCVWHTRLLIRRPSVRPSRDRDAALAIITIKGVGRPFGHAGRQVGWPAPDQTRRISEPQREERILAEPNCRGRFIAAEN